MAASILFWIKDMGLVCVMLLGFAFIFVLLSLFMREIESVTPWWKRKTVDRKGELSHQ